MYPLPQVHDNLRTLVAGYMTHDVLNAEVSRITCVHDTSVQASDFLGDPNGVRTVSAIIGKRMFSPAVNPSTENLVSCLSTLKLEPRAVQVRVLISSSGRLH